MNLNTNLGECCSFDLSALNINENLKFIEVIGPFIAFSN